MARRVGLLLVILLGTLPGCGASASMAAVEAAESQARSARADATREHARLVELEARLVEMERRSARQARACPAAPEPRSVDVASALVHPKPDPLRSQGDFSAEAQPAAPAAPPAAKLALGASPPPAGAAPERDRLEQLLEGLREYGTDKPSGLSIERREALRVLLRRERQLDLMNPWDGH
jgi:hypothetical protein